MIVFARLMMAAGICGVLAMAPVAVQADEDEGNPLATIPLRPIGPAITSGRISDFAFYPGGDHKFLVGVASGNLFKTDNGGTTWTPIFENEGSYAIGVVEIDPNDTKSIGVSDSQSSRSRMRSPGAIPLK